MSVGNLDQGDFKTHDKILETVSVDIHWRGAEFIGIYRGYGAEEVKDGGAAGVAVGGGATEGARGVAQDAAGHDVAADDAAAQG